jgi:hypothetical protein
VFLHRNPQSHRPPQTKHHVQLIQTVIPNRNLEEVLIEVLHDYDLWRLLEQLLHARMSDTENPSQTKKDSPAHGSRHPGSSKLSPHGSKKAFGVQILMVQQSPTSTQEPRPQHGSKHQSTSPPKANPSGYTPGCPDPGGDPDQLHRF